MDDMTDATARLVRLLARVERSLERRIGEAREAMAALSTLRREHDALIAEHDRLRAEVEALRDSRTDVEAVRASEQALRAEAAEALDRAIAELRSMGDAGG